MVKISVIVPVYNVGKYLSKCLESLLNQTFSDIEIICINDGSMDNSGQILEEFVQKDSRIKVINQSNSGVSVARNNGIAAATGDYIMFLDGDDYYTCDACRIAYEGIVGSGSDIAVFGMIEKYWIFLKSGRVNKSIRKALKAQEPDLWKFQTFCWNKIYKTDFIKQNKIVFPVGIKASEDGIFSLICLFNNAKYSFIDKSLYVYRKNRVGSATSNFGGIKNDFEGFKAFFAMEIFQNQSCEDQLRVVEKFCSGIWTAYKQHRNNELLVDIQTFLDFIESKYEESKLRQFKKYNQLKGLI